jgi:hypothetical protein
VYFQVIERVNLRAQTFESMNISRSPSLLASTWSLFTGSLLNDCGGYPASPKARRVSRLSFSDDTDHDKEDIRGASPKLYPNVDGLCDIWQFDMVARQENAVDALYCSQHTITCMSNDMTILPGRE